MDEVLAYALAWQCDRDLLLALPESRERQTLARLAWAILPSECSFTTLTGCDQL